ncbi:MAG: ATP-binding protein [Desulfobacteraceae bacterium]|jgi:two-component system sensor histidine kinase QseC
MNSIQGRLSRSLLLGAGFLLLIAFTILEARFRQQLEREFDRNLLAKTMTLVTLTTQHTGRVELDFADEFMPEFEAPTHPEYFQLWLADGTLLERSRSLGKQNLPRDELPLDQPSFKNMCLPDGREGRLIQIRFIPHTKDKPGEEHPNTEYILKPKRDRQSNMQAHICVARGRDDLDALIWTTRCTLGATGLFMLIAMILLVRLSVFRGLEPLRDISDQVQSMNAESFDERIQLKRRIQELDPIVKQLNRLLDRLSASFKREKQFSSNVAHELRTTLAELRTMAEVGGRWPDDKEMIKDFFDDLLDVTEDMYYTITNLLELARCESGKQEIEEHPVNLAELVQETWNRFADQAGEKGLEIDNRLDHVIVQTDRRKVELILVNLFKNAVEYSPPNEKIIVSTKRDGTAIGLTFVNTTHDLDESDLASLFDRYWRKDAARTSRHHVGLGLSLVKALADALNLNLSPRLRHGKTFQIELSGFSPATV